MRYLTLVVVLFLSWGMKFSPASECPLCIGHGGTCGCNMGAVVCCDRTLAIGCACE